MLPWLTSIIKIYSVGMAYHGVLQYKIALFYLEKYKEFSNYLILSFPEHKHYCGDILRNYKIQEIKFIHLKK